MIRVDGVEYDPIVQRGLTGWMVSDSDGTIYSVGYKTEAKAGTALTEIKPQIQRNSQT